MNKLLLLPTPSSISYMWNFGSLLGMMLGGQVLTGLVLTMHYSADLHSAFYSLVHISFDINKGYLLRYFHANGATLFFMFIYLHISRGIYYKSYTSSKLVWLSGITMLIFYMCIAFLGYVLPWGQMSFWGATVITNLISALPYLGGSLVEWVWGGFSVGGPTLSRFYSLHFLLPFLSMGLVMTHLFVLHKVGSSNPLGLTQNSDKVSFHPHYSLKDLLGLYILLILAFYIVSHWPLMFMDSDNFIEANPLSTPAHIQPEWYFLFAYAILRSIPSKLGGVVSLIMSILIMTFFSIISKTSYSKSVLHQVLSMLLFMTFIVLTFLGAMPVEHPYSLMSVWATSIYFSTNLLLMSV